MNEAFLNHGRWLVRCPKCGTAHLISPKDESFICLVCYPEQRAMLLEALPDNPRQFRRVPDTEERKRAEQRAQKDQAVYPISFKENPSTIEKLVAGREPRYRNWTSDMKLDDLLAENKDQPWNWRENKRWPRRKR